MTKREAELKAAFLTKLKFRFPTLVVLEFATAGAPDRAFVLNQRTSFWEFKHACPGCEFQDLQLVTCLRLEREAHCRYVIWQGAEFRTCIVRPSQVRLNMHGHDMQYEATTPGFDHDWLAERVQRVHLL